MRITGENENYFFSSDAIRSFSSSSCALLAANVASACTRRASKLVLLTSMLACACSLLLSAWILLLSAMRVNITRSTSCGGRGAPGARSLVNGNEDEGEDDDEEEDADD